MKRSELKQLIKEVLLNEAIEASADVIKKIDGLTDKNNHTEARLELAKLIKDRKLIDAYNAINVLSDYFGDANDTNPLRDKLDKDLFKFAKTKLSNFDEIKKSF